MRFLRTTLLALTVSAGAASGIFVPNDANASVSIAVGFDALVKDADAVAIAVPQEQKSLWEDGRIYTYTRVKVEQGVAGEAGTGSEGWVRTLGGVVGKIGQLVDGEPVLAVGKPSLLFLRKFKAGGTWEVAARAQGQYPVVIDEVSKARKLMRSSAVGVLYPPKAKPAERASTSVQPQSQGPETYTPQAPPVLKIRLAQEALHDRPVDDAAREIAATWRKAHPQPESAPTSK